MKYLDFKTSVWERIEVDEQHLPELLKAFESGEITCMGDAEDILGPSMYDYIETIYDTTETMSIYQNQGCPTVELVEESGLGVVSNKVDFNDFRKQVLNAHDNAYGAQMLLPSDIKKIQHKLMLARIHQ